MSTHAPQIIFRNPGLRAVSVAGRPRLNWELDVARQVQARLFPREQPFYPGLDFFGSWRAARGVSGDYLDYLELPGGNLGIAIGDVAGKGVSAALLMSSLHSLVRTLGASGQSTLAELAASINRHFLRVSPENCFASLFLGRYNPSRRELRYLNAGHEPPFILRGDGADARLIELCAGGPVIGMLPDAHYQEDSVQLATGDILVAYTDGVCDLQNPYGEDWGRERLVNAVKKHSRASAREMVREVLNEMDAFANGEPQFDDFTLWIARTGSSEAVMPFEEGSGALAA